MAAKSEFSKKQASLGNITIILVEPLHPGNIGAACRAMKNMGLGRLKLVHPPLDRNNDALKMAHGAEDILENATRYLTLGEALADIQYVIGATARLGGWREQALPPREAAEDILHIASSGNRVAILFGSEDRGLSNEHIKHCQRLISIPSSPEQRSLNLAQSVLIVAYELFLATLGKLPPGPKLAGAGHVEAMFEDLTEALRLIDFLKPGNPDYWVMSIKRVFGRSGLSEKEVNMFRGICRQIRWIHSLVDEKGKTNEKSET